MMVFYIRRMIILASCFFVSSIYASLILVLTCAVNHIYTIYIGDTKPLKGRWLNILEMLNEFFVASSTLFVMTISNWVGSQLKKYFNGFAFIIIVLLHSGINVIFILYKSFNNVILIFTKFYNFMASYLNKSNQAKRSLDINEKKSKQIYFPTNINEGN